tara:strand:- start:4842 stop:5447 length:606 start_codon:yes stop_codon:yes gene_type:complete
MVTLNNKEDNNEEEIVNLLITDKQFKTAEDFKSEKETLKNKKSDSCQELKNLAYKTMLLNGNDILQKNDNISNDNKINSFLVDESNANKAETWTKLNKTQKILRLNNYVETILKTKYNLSNDEVIHTKNYLQKSIDRKNLSKAKEIVYNKEENFIINIPFFIFNEDTRIFILKKDDKHISTVKCLPQDKRSKVKTLKIHDE